MLSLLPNISRNENSFNVNLLHQILTVLGFKVANSEFIQMKAGNSTLRQVRSLREELGIESDTQLLIDDITARAIAKALKERGFHEAQRSFTIRGTVRGHNGHAIRRQTLLVFDLDLKGVATYKTARSTTDLGQKQGFEFLGPAQTNNQGEYQLTFFDWQYGAAERKKADVVVFAVHDGAILGLSQLVNSDKYSQKGIVHNLDVIIASQKQRTEYDLVMKALNEFLKESQSSFEQVVDSDEQLAFLSGELDIEANKINTAASATRLIRDCTEELPHELLYGLGRQEIPLSLYELSWHNKNELMTALHESVNENMIREYSSKERSYFVETLLECSYRRTADEDAQDSPDSLGALLSFSLPTESHKLSFLRALNSFTGSNFQQFWEEHLPQYAEFNNHPELIKSLQLTHELSGITANYPPLIKQLQVNNQIQSISDLLLLEKEDWDKIVSKTGFPDSQSGDTDINSSKNKYIENIQNKLNEALPTERIALMAERNELEIESAHVAKSIVAFLANNRSFNIVTSRIDNFNEQIREVAGNDTSEVIKELKICQRLEQITKEPQSIQYLKRNNIYAARMIAEIPRRIFVKQHADGLGGTKRAELLHGHSTYLSKRAEHNGMTLMDYTGQKSPDAVMAVSERESSIETAKEYIHNYSEIFGSPDLCECEQCNSVYGPAAYFVDLLRFLWRGEPNDSEKTPLDVLSKRRPDLVHLPLTCENANKQIPYIDLAVEVMEHLTAYGSLSSFKGYDTGDATEAELSASPQHSNAMAYTVLHDSKYPFSLPYHKPLDIIRTYQNRLDITRAEVLKAVNPDPSESTSRMIEAESLELSAEEYLIITSQSFEGDADTTTLHSYYGLSDSDDLDDLSHVRSFLRISGLKYTDLVELVKTSYVNPHKPTLDFIQELFSYGSIDGDVMYTTLSQIENGALRAADDEILTTILAAYNAAHDGDLSPHDFDQWVTDSFDNFKLVITLFEPESKCNLDNTRLMTIQSLFEPTSESWTEAHSGITDETWSKLHRFIRLRNKLGWTIHETDLALKGLSDDDISPDTIRNLMIVNELTKSTGIAVESLIVLWTDIDSSGTDSLYKTLFLNKAAQTIDDVFQPDLWGRILQDETIILEDHKLAILAAFGITETDLSAILEVARTKTGGRLLPINLTTDSLSVHNLSVLYRFVVLAQMLKMPIIDLCRATVLFEPYPFSIWDADSGHFISIDPRLTLQFFEFMESVSEFGFTVPQLEYIFQETMHSEQTRAIQRDSISEAIRSIKHDLHTIENGYPTAPSSELTIEALISILELTYASDVVALLANLLTCAFQYDVVTDRNLDISFPDNLSGHYSYIAASGRLRCNIIMTANDRDLLVSLPNATDNFKTAIEELYFSPQKLLNTHFGDLFDDQLMAYQILLDRPPQPEKSSLRQKLLYIYDSFIPRLKRRLRQSSLERHFATAIEVDADTIHFLLKKEIDDLVTSISTEGFSAQYYSDATLTNEVLTRTEDTVDFDWGIDAPATSVPADNFSARWSAHLTAPAPGTYTIIVSVKEADDTFRFYFDGELLLEKATGEVKTSMEALVELNDSHLHEIILEYADITDKAGISLQWKTTLSGLAFIPASTVVPTAIIEQITERLTQLHRAALFLKGFELNANEVAHLVRYSSDFAEIDFSALTPLHWERIRDYVHLKNSIALTNLSLLDVFTLANRADPLPTLEELTALLNSATDWDRSDLDYLVGTHFGLNTEAFKSPMALIQIGSVIELAKRTGLSAQTLVSLGEAAWDYEVLDTLSQLVREAMNSLHGRDDMLTISRELNNSIRERAQAALVSHLLQTESVRNAGVTGPDGLFEYLLIDVQMSSCMNTSRIVQASAAVQLFVNRVLLNLENRPATDPENSVQPSAIDKDRWEWMRYYRTWEANRRIFLYPENWLEPEWRHDRSEFFCEVESYLIQNDITERSVEESVRNYLNSLNEVANLEVCGMFKENHNDTDYTLHIFGRTHTPPCRFFYRTWDSFEQWTPWKSVPVDIACTEDGDKSGVHLVPVVWKKRLLLFWLEFSSVHFTVPQDRNSVDGLADAPMNTYQSYEKWQTRLAWSEYIDGKWTPKHVSSEYLEPGIRSGFGEHLNIFSCTPVFDHTNNSLNLYLWHEKYGQGLEHFELSDISSPIKAVNPLAGVSSHEEYTYECFFMRWRRADAKLRFKRQSYLLEHHTHFLLFHNLIDDRDDQLSSPFFYSDNSRTYFVNPWRLNWWSRNKTSLEFHTFHHPYVNQYTEQLNRSGLKGLFESNIDLPNDNGFTFENTYHPNSQSVDERTTFAQHTYYKENVCFDLLGANSLYNWELFYHIPLYIATRLSKNGRYEEALKWFHFIFDPTSDAPSLEGEESTQRIWKVFPFRNKSAKDRLEDWFKSLEPGSGPTASDEEPAIREWRERPFDPHLIAARREIPYMKHVVIKYVENLIEWGDFKFKQFTRDSVYEALQIYVIAKHVLGPRPEFVPKRGKIKSETYESLKDKWDDFSNALVELENLFPYSSSPRTGESSTVPSILGLGPALYFCIPENDKLLKHWDTVADRLYKIRHCQDISGASRDLALFAPRIEPDVLIQAAAHGVSLGDILADLNSPPPNYRFSYLAQKANEFCADVKTLGGEVLSAIEKKTSEDLTKLRTSHEKSMLQLLTSAKECRVLEVKSNKDSLLKSRETASIRLQHYASLLGVTITVPEPPSIGSDLTIDTQLPPDTGLPLIETDVDDSLVDADEAGIKLIPKELEDLDKREAAKWITSAAGISESLAGVFNLFPNIEGKAQPLGVGVGTVWGGQNLGAGTSALAKAASAVGSFLSQEAAQAATTASYIRREQEWTLQANLAAREIIQLDKQLVAADIQIQITEKELLQHKHGIKNTEEIEHFLQNSFSNVELYQWMKEQVFSVYKQSYDLAYSMCKQAEKCYQFEMGTETTDFIQYGYWDSTKMGLTSGNKLLLGMRQMEKSYLEHNRRELELRKSVSLLHLNPLSLIQLKETGICYVSIPEELFDLDYQGHYFRRIKSIALTIPCVSGPYSSVTCSIRLLSNTMRLNTAMNQQGKYQHENDDGLWIDDDRFRTSHIPVTSIATSSAQNDSGMFELNYRDERYLPFEGAGAISNWEIRLTETQELRQFDYSTISDVILHINYTARESGKPFRDKVVEYLKEYVAHSTSLLGQPLTTMQDLRREYPSEWHRLLSGGLENEKHELIITVGNERFPFFAQKRDIIVKRISCFAKTSSSGNLPLVITYTKRDNSLSDPITLTLTTKDPYGSLKRVTTDETTTSLDQLDISGELRFSLDTEISTVKEVFLVFHYELGSELT